MIFVEKLVGKAYCILTSKQKCMEYFDKRQYLLEEEDVRAFLYKRFGTLIYHTSSPVLPFSPETMALRELMKRDPELAEKVWINEMRNAFMIPSGDLVERHERYRERR